MKTPAVPKTEAPIKDPGRRWFVTRFTSRTVMAAIGALAVGRLIEKDAPVVQAADGDALVIGHANTGSSLTTLTSSPPGNSTPAFAVGNLSNQGAGIQGNVNAPSGETKGVVGISTSPDGMGVFGYAPSTSVGTIAARPVGVVGYSAGPAGTGVHGRAASTTGQTTGTVGAADSNDGVGVFGFASSTSAGTIVGRPTGMVGYSAGPGGTGVHGRAASPAGQTTGTVGAADSPDGIGVAGFISSNSSGTVPGRPIGVAGFTASPTGRGVDGNAASPIGQTIGVTGEAASPDGIGVAGTATATSGPARGVTGTSLSPGGIGVEASNPVGKALQVDGLAAFSTVGSAIIPAGQASETISDHRVTARSHVTVVLTGDPGLSGGPRLRPAVSWVERTAGTGFTVHLTRAAANATPLTYLIVEPT